MALPSSWVDHLFARLTVRYGASFLRQWPDTDLAVVKADWADVLDGVRGEAISYALRYLPTDRPVNAMQFREVCRRAPPPELPRIEASPEPKADPKRVAELVAKVVAQPDDGMTPAERVAAGLRARMQAGERLSAAQLSMLRSCETRGTFTTEPGEFRMIPPDCLPPAMRQEVRA